MEGDIGVYIVYFCQFSVCYLNSQYSFLLGTIIIFFLAMFEPFFCVSQGQRVLFIFFLFGWGLDLYAHAQNVLRMCI